MPQSVDPLSGLSLPPEMLTAALAGPWTAETIGEFLAVAGEHGRSTTVVAHTETRQPVFEEYQTFSWKAPVRLLDHDLWVWVLAYEDRNPEEWVWLVEVWDSPEETNGTVLTAARTAERAAALRLLAVVLNLSDLAAAESAQ